MKNTEQKPAKLLKTLPSGNLGKYPSVDIALNEKHKKANEFIKKVKLTF